MRQPAVCVKLRVRQATVLHCGLWEQDAETLLWERGADPVWWPRSVDWQRQGVRSRARAGEAGVLLVAMAMSWSCSGRALGRQAMRHRAWALHPGTQSGCAQAPPCSRVDITFPRSLYANTVFSNSSHSSSSRATPSAAAGCSTMPQDVETGADTKARGMENKGWKIKMLYDGECPLCMREVNMLRERNKSYGDGIKFVDICAADYAAEENCKIDFETAMGRIHAIRQDGEVLTNIAAFRALYDEVGLGWVYAITNYQPWASILDTVYEFWAKYRLPITGRPSLAEVLEKRRQSKVEGGKSSADERRCRLD